MKKTVSHGHRIRKLGANRYEISWAFNGAVPGSRFLRPRRGYREVNEATARRFAQKWGIGMPAEDQ